MDLAKLFSVAVSKKDEQWEHEIIRTKYDLKHWLDIEKNTMLANLAQLGRNRKGLYMEVPKTTENDRILS